MGQNWWGVGGSTHSLLTLLNAMYNVQSVQAGNATSRASELLLQSLRVQNTKNNACLHLPQCCHRSNKVVLTSLPF